MSGPPPGWHPDPSAPGGWRWWDGTAWTEHASSGAVGAGGGFFAGIDRALQARNAGGHRFAAEQRGRHPLPTQALSSRRSVQRRVIPVLVIALAVISMMGRLVVDVLGPEQSITDPPTPPVLRFVLLAAAVAAGVAAVVLWRRRFTVVDTPTVEISGAHPGLCELSGFARPMGEAATSWFCGAPTVWWESSVEQRRGSGKSARWVTEWTARGGQERFLLVDEHGAAIEVDARDARFDGERTLLTKGIADRRRLIEKALVSGDHLYVLGPVRVTGDGRLRVQKRPDPGGPEEGMTDVRTRLPLWLMQGGESGVARTLLLVALAATVVTVVGVAAFTAVEPTEDRFGRSALKLREEGSLLLPALAASAVVIGAFALGYTWRLWNRLVELRWQAAHAWSLIEVAVTARAGLIANLVAVTRAVAAHERTALIDTATGRGGLPRADGVAAVDDAVAAENRDRAVLVAQVEVHPELGADALFGQLFTQLVTTENRLAACRRFYNDAVTVLADRTGTLPGLLFKPFVAPEVPPLLAFELHGVAAPSVAGATALPP